MTLRPENVRRLPEEPTSFSASPVEIAPPTCDPGAPEVPSASQIWISKLPLVQFTFQSRSETLPSTKPEAVVENPSALHCELFTTKAPFGEPAERLSKRINSARNHYQEKPKKHSCEMNPWRRVDLAVLEKTAHRRSGVRSKLQTDPLLLPAKLRRTSAAAPGYL